MRSDMPVRHQWTNSALILVGCATVVSTLILHSLHGDRATGLSDRQFVLLFFGISMLFWGAMRVGPLGRPSTLLESQRPLPRKWIDALGATNLVGFIGYAVLSYGMTPQLPFGTSQPYNAEYYRLISQSVSILGPGAQAFVTGNSILAQPAIFLIAYTSPLLVASGVFLVLLATLARHRNGITTDTPKRLVTWAAASAVANMLASPVLVHDFWYPLAWGRMVVAGANPYYITLTSEYTHSLALNASHERMMYGPLLALIAGAVVWVAGSQALLGAALFKLLLTAAWIGSLCLILTLLRDRPLWNQCIGIATFGWLPVSVEQAAGDGHNDVLMIFFLLLWLYCLERDRRILGSLALAASVSIKYITAPVFMLDLAHHVLSRRRNLLQYVPGALAATGFGVVAFGAFYRSPAFFEPLWPRTNWQFFALRDAVIAIEILLGRHLPGQAAQAAQVFFPAIAVYYGIEYLKRPTRYHLRVTLLAIIAALLFGYISGLWPWYLVWVLAVAALVPETLVARWVQGAALAAPFAIMVWIVFPKIDPFFIFNLPALGMYAFVALWIILAPRSWFPDAESTVVLRPDWEVPGARSPLVIAGASAERNKPT